MSSLNTSDKDRNAVSERTEERGANAYIGARIEERRETLGLSQRQVAALLNVSEQQLAKYERGVDAIPPGVLKEIAQALTVSVAWFFFGLMVDLGLRRTTGAADTPDQGTSALFERQHLREELNNMAWSLARQALARQGTSA